MSTSITTVYDALITRIEAILTSHKRLSNPYKLEENADIFLRQGYGLAIGVGSNTNRQLGCLLSIGREFKIAITRQYYATELNPAGKATTEKQIMEDLRSIVADFEQNTTLTTGSQIVRFNSDSGIGFVQGQTDRYMFTEAIFNIEYFETIP